MDKKKIIIITVIMFIIVVLLIYNNKKVKNDNSNINFNESDFNVIYSFDETNNIYTIYDKNTNEVIREFQDELMLKFYLDNPDYDPSFETESNETVEDLN